MTAWAEIRRRRPFLLLRSHEVGGRRLRQRSEVRQVQRVEVDEGATAKGAPRRAAITRGSIHFQMGPIDLV
jgi:hypothetical protein